MNKRRAVVFVACLIALSISGVLLVKQFSSDTGTPPKQVETLKAPTINMGQISLYLKGKDQLFGQKDKDYAKYKKLIEEVVYTIQGPALNGAVLAEGDMEVATEKVQLTQDKLPTINQVKNSAIGVGSYLLGNVDLKTNYRPDAKASFANTKLDKDGKLLINTDHIVITAGSYYRGILFTRHSYDSMKWSAWQVDKQQLMKLVEALRLGSTSSQPGENVKVK